MRRVLATTDLGPTYDGASKPHRVAADDGKEYVVKFATPEWPRALFNEGVGASLARNLGLPMPDFVAVEFTADFLYACPSLSRRGILPGLYFGVEFLRSGFDLTSIDADGVLPELVANRGDAAGIVAFDNWIYHADRSLGNILAVPTKVHGDTRFHLYIIDHGLILTSGAWTTEDLTDLQGDTTPAEGAGILRRCVWAAEEFEPHLVNIEALTEEVLINVLSTVEVSWPLPEAERDAVKGFILGRATSVRNIIQASLPSFPRLLI